MHLVAVTVHYLFQVILTLEFKYSNYFEFEVKLFTKINRFIHGTTKIDLLVLVMYSYFK